jgi:hypothetical protein
MKTVSARQANVLTCFSLDIQTYGHDQVALELTGNSAFSSVTFFSDGSNAFEFMRL